MNLHRGALALSLLLISCAAQRPVLYPNEKYRRAGTASADRDINDCMREAEDYVASAGRTGKVLEGVAVGAGSSAAIGAAAGAAGGAVVGSPGIWAAVGAAGGAAGSTASGLIHELTRKESPSPVYRNFVDHCLREKGYDPIGWN